MTAEQTPQSSPEDLLDQAAGEWVNLHQASKMTGLSEPALRNRISRGVLKSRRIFDRVVVARKDVAALANRGNERK